MPFTESLIAKVIVKIVERSAEITWKSLTRNDKILQVFKSAGLNTDKPSPDFESLYAHTLVEYGIDQPEPILNFFRHKDIQNAFQQSFDKNDPSILVHEAAGLIEWSRIGDELRELERDPRLEFARFTFVFHEMVSRTRTPAQVRVEHKIDQILEIVNEKDLAKIRCRNIESMQGTLPEKLKSWFKTLGYGTDSHDIQTDTYAEWIIKIPARRGFDSILVRCIQTQAEVKHLESLKSAVREHKTDEGWLIAAHRKSRSAMEWAEKEDTIFCHTFDELLDEQADFSGYFNWLENFVKERSIDENYIPLACRRDILNPETGEKTGEEHYGKDYGWIEGYINKWLDDPCKEHISILGEFGTGKTWFTHHYAWLLMKKYREAKEKGLARPRLPLVIQLRDYAKALDCQNLIADFFFRKHEINLPGYSAFEQLNRMGRLLLIFDGFDEMADKLDRQKMINNFWELARVVVPGAKAILTCRTEHFPHAKEGRDLLNAQLKASTAYLTGNPPQFEILELELFNEDQIRAVLSKQAKKPEDVDLIMAHAALIELATRPVMLELILEALPDIEAGKPIDLSRIYLYAIRKKLDRNIQPWRTFTSMADKMYFMCEVSHEMLTLDKMSLNYRLFPDRLKNLFGPVVAEQKDLDHWHYDMMGNSLLIRNDDGDYAPAHRSFPEFFVAFKLAAQLGLLPADFTDAVRAHSNVDESADPIPCTWNGYFRREADKDGNIRQMPPLKYFEAEDAENALETLGRMGDAVLRLVHEMTNVDDIRIRLHERLARVLGEFKNGSRDPAKQQNIIRFILKYRVLSQEWEEAANQGDAIRGFWEKHLEQEKAAAEKGVGREVFKVQCQETDPIVIEMVRAPSGSFLMGDEDIGPIHRVHITRPYLIAAVPVTQKFYQAITGKNPSRFKGDELPVEKVTWFDAVNFCNQLSEKMNLDPVYKIKGEQVVWDRESMGFRLPTEAEWEYSCRAGTTSRFACGDLESELETMAWYKENNQGSLHSVGQKTANCWGVYDMHGHLWEWMWDRYKRYTELAINDSIGFYSSSVRVIRGGSWGVAAIYCRSAFRNDSPSGYSSGALGFRLSRSVALVP